VTSLLLQHLGAPSSAREARALDSARKRAVDELAGRTVWCASALRASGDSAGLLRSSLRWAGDDGVIASRLDVLAGEPLRQLAERLDEMLHGAAYGHPGAGEQEIYADGMRVGETLVGPDVRADDVVVAHDPLTALLAQAIRERGAHTVWHVSVAPGAPGAAVREALAFVRRFTSGLDAYVVRSGAHVTALMPSADIVADTEAHGDPYRDVGWGSMLAAVVHADRDETVGGRRHPRPAVAAR
jgi:hypothetical protein